MTHADTSQRPRTVNTAAAILWASAFLLAAIVLIQAGQHLDAPAHAAMSNTSAGYTMLTTHASQTVTTPVEVLYVIDDRSEMLYVYEVENAQQRKITLHHGGSLANLFRNAGR